MNQSTAVCQGVLVNPLPGEEGCHFELPRAVSHNEDVARVIFIVHVAQPSCWQAEGSDDMYNCGKKERGEESCKGKLSFQLGFQSSGGGGLD